MGKKHEPRSENSSRRMSTWLIRGDGGVIGSLTTHGTSFAYSSVCSPL